MVIFHSYVSLPEGKPLIIWSLQMTTQPTIPMIPTMITMVDGKRPTDVVPVILSRGE